MSNLNKYFTVYDNKGATLDRYLIKCIDYPDETLFCSEDPTHSTGVSTFYNGIINPPANLMIPFNTLSHKLQAHIIERFYNDAMVAKNCKIAHQRINNNYNARA